MKTEVRTSLECARNQCSCSRIEEIQRQEKLGPEPRPRRVLCNDDDSDFQSSRDNHGSLLRIDLRSRIKVGRILP